MDFCINGFWNWLGLSGSTWPMVTSSRQITEVKQRRARLVLGWVTAARITLPAMCRGVGQASHITPPLSTQQ